MSDQPLPGVPGESSEAGGTAPAVAEEPDPLLEVPDRSHRILVTGATGFLGAHLIPRLVGRGHEVRGLARGVPPPPGQAADLEVEWWTADVTDPADLIGAAGECDRVIHLAGSFVPDSEQGAGRVHLEGTQNVLREAEDAGVERFVYVSALGARPTGEEFYRSKFRAEEEVRRAAVEGLVFRPAVVYGPGDHLTSWLRAVLQSYPVFPLFGAGDFRLQPVAIEDVVDALCQAVERPGFEEDTFELAGPRPLDLEEVVRAVGEAVGAERPLVRLPLLLLGPLSAFARWRGWPPPPHPERLERLQGSGVPAGSEQALRRVFRLEPLPFREVLADYL